MIANKLFGRDLLLIHGGIWVQPGKFRGNGAVKATFGCLRVRNTDMFFLKELVSGNSDISVIVRDTI